MRQDLLYLLKEYLTITKRMNPTEAYQVANKILAKLDSDSLTDIN